MTRLLKTLSAGVCALALVSCASTKPITSAKLDRNFDVVPGAYEPGDHDPVAKAAFWGTRYDREPDNPEVAVALSESLRAMGSNAEAMNVMQRSFQQFSGRPDVALEYGKVLIANDRAFEAVRPLEQAIQTGKGSDWRAYSAYGVALDKIGEHRGAREQYDQALKLNPNSPTVLNNKGLSYALSGQLNNAEQTLRYAAATTAGTPTVRQNLALILAFKGDTAEAERLARSDLPPRVADNNTAYFRSLVSQPAYWQAYAGDNVEMPTFDDTPPEPTFEDATVPAFNEPAPAPVPARKPTPEPEEDPFAGADVLSSLEAPQITGPAVAGTPVALENAALGEESDTE